MRARKRKLYRIEMRSLKTSNSILIWCAFFTILKHSSHLSHSFVDVKVQFSSNIERDSLITTTLVLHRNEWHSHWVTLLSWVRDLRGSRINRQIQQSIAAFLCGKVLFDFLACSASSSGHFHDLHIPCDGLVACFARFLAHACTEGDPSPVFRAI